jgi:hypothetical protein
MRIDEAPEPVHINHFSGSYWRMCSINNREETRREEERRA